MNKENCALKLVEEIMVTTLSILLDTLENRVLRAIFEPKKQKVRT